MKHRAYILALLPALMWACSSETETSAPVPAAAGPASSASGANAPQTADSLLADVSSALGANGLNSITYSGKAWRIRNSFMQTPNASPPWTLRDDINDYRRTIDLNAPASLAVGETFAGNLFFAPPVKGTYTQNIEADDTQWSDQLEIWLTPWGFIRGAQTNGVSTREAMINGNNYSVLTWSSGESQRSPSGIRYTVNGYVNDDDLLDRVETWVEHPFMGDFHIVQTFSDYQEFGGLMVPTIMNQQRGGGDVFGVIVTRAAANPGNLAALMTPPEAPAGGGFGGGGEPPTNIVEQLDDGVWLITGGYVALVAEFADHVMVFESGQSEARGQRIWDEVSALLPNKPIRYIVNSHPHSDHTAGLVPFIRNGATLVTHANNVDFLRMALSTPRTLLGEATMNVEVEGVSGVGVYEDNTMRVELHSVPNGHTDGMLVAVLPEQGILFQADFTLPQPGVEANPFVKTLANYIADNNVQFDQYLAVHAAAEPQTRADLLATIGR